MIVTILNDVLVHRLQAIADQQGCSIEDVLHHVLEHSLVEQETQAVIPGAVKPLIRQVSLGHTDHHKTATMEIPADLRKLLDESA